MRKPLVWHPSPFPSPDGARLSETLPESLRRVATLSPDRPAVVFGQQVWSYGMLASRAAGLAEEIHEATERQGPVALVLPVGIDAVAAWFACSLAGRPLVLLEPDHPSERLNELMSAAGCVLALCDEVTAKAVQHSSPVKVLQSDGRCGVLSPGRGLGSTDPCLVFPTSGSTGHPKLVTYAASTLQAKAQSSVELMRVPEGASVVIAGSHGNYGFLHHAMVFLLSGGTLCLADVRSRGVPSVLEAIEILGARHARFTPSMFRALAVREEHLKALRLLHAARFSGEPLLTTDLQLARRVFRPDCLVQNVYGSTESALFIWSCHAGDTEPEGPTVPIGHIYPMASYAIEPLSPDDLEDATGELHIRSAFQALGDFRTGSIDNSRFPVCGTVGTERVYATGDVVRRLVDGSLLHLGRTGRMVKIRGQRVFLSEVENQLQRLPGVRAAAVVEYAEQNETVLYGFVTTNANGESTSDLRTRLATQLPAFMVPRELISLEQLPLLPGGKVDYLNLLNKVHFLVTTKTSQHPTARQNPCASLSDMWDGILFDGAHLHDADFESLGGDSLKLMNLSIELEKALNKPFPLEAFLANSTFKHLSELLEITPGHEHNQTGK